MCTSQASGFTYRIWVVWDSPTQYPTNNPGTITVSVAGLDGADPSGTYAFNPDTTSVGFKRLVAAFDVPTNYGPGGPNYATWTVSGTYNGGTIGGSGRVPGLYGDFTPPGSSEVDAFLIADPPPGPGYTKANDPKLGGNQCKTTVGGTGAAGPPMAQYSAHAMRASLNIEDTPFRYTPGRGPAINFTVTYNQRETHQPANFTYSNLGPRWTFNWLSYVTDDPNNSAKAVVYVPGGGAESYSGFDSGSQSYPPDPQSHAVLFRTSPAPIKYERRFPDGSKQVYAQSDNSSSDPRRIFMTEVFDPAGNKVTINYYPNSLRIQSITDALGYTTTLSYDPNQPLKITAVTEPTEFGTRSASFSYNGNGQLKTITDQIGIQSAMGYEPSSNFVNSLTTPYGTATFARGGSETTRSIEMTDPTGIATERVEYRDSTSGIGASESIPNGFTNVGLDTTNTFYWDKKAYSSYPDYTKARITHWLYNSDGSISGVSHSEKEPLENRVWYKYKDQPDSTKIGPSANPIQVARVLDNTNPATSTKLWQYEYNNSFGKMTKSTDPRGRVMSYDYDPVNNIDLLTVRQTTGSNNEMLRTLTYNSLHEPLTDTDAAGQTTTYTYRSDGHGQLETVQNAKGETTICLYGPATNVPTNYLASITSPPFNGSSAITTFEYDSANRVHKVKNVADDYIVTTDYDDLDRPTQISYPDGTNQQFQYVQEFDDRLGPRKILDLTTSIDRRGRPTVRHYDRNRHMESITDPLNRTTTYGWCNCGSLESITDPNNHTTTFFRDLQSRVYRKEFADGKGINFLYEGQTAPNTIGTTSRLKSMTDALNQTTNYQYFLDNDIQQVSYANAQQSTPTVNFTYDLNYNRVATMVDGTGTTTYTYYPVDNPPALGANHLQSTDGPQGSVAYTYDELGRPLDDGSSVLTYDSLGRVSTTENLLGHFTRTYDGVTPRLKKLAYPNGQTANYNYFDNGHDRRLQTLQNVANSGANLSKFDYTYDPEGQVVTWTKQIGANSPVAGTYSYDLADQLTGASNATSGGVLPGNFTYGYDLAGNRTNDAVLPTMHTFNNVNESQDPGYTYDANGNLTSDVTNKYFWDAANRLVAMETTAAVGGQNPTSVSVPMPPTAHPILPTPTPTPSSSPSTAAVLTRSEFTYDGLGRRVRIVIKQASGNPLPQNPNWSLVSDRSYAWNGNGLLSEYDSRAPFGKGFFDEGVLDGEYCHGPLYYSRDHLGSIREMTDGNSALRAQYEYDPFGNRTKLSGNLDADFAFTGHWYHTVTGHNLALYRAYSPTLGRWISRDPIGEAGGTNLYAYVGNNPTNTIDPLGLRDIYVAYWRPVYPYFAFGGGVGHVAAFELNGQVILSQFPDPHGVQGVNSTRSYLDTVDSEYGRQPDKVWRVSIEDDVDFNAAASENRTRDSWSIFPFPLKTQCASSVSDALRSGGVPVDYSFFPKNLAAQLDSLSDGYRGVSFRPIPPQPIVSVPSNSVPWSLPWR